MRTVAITSIVGLLIVGAPQLDAERDGARLQTAPSQQPPPAPPDQVGRAGRQGQRNPAEAGMNMADVNDMFRGVEINQAERFLQLTDKQWAPFMNEFRQLQRVRDQHQMQRNRMLMAIRQAINGANNQPPADDPALEGLLKKLDDLEQRTEQELKARHAAVDAVLSVRQRARFRLFQEQMERYKIELLAKVLRSQGRGPDPQPPIVR
jgi:hypothetical protein